MTPTQPLETWLTYGEDGLLASLDIEHPAQNAGVEIFEGASNFACTGLFRGATDSNGNGVPDTCECPADLNSDGAVDAQDLAILIDMWGTSGAADLDHDGTVGAIDLAILIGSWGTEAG